MLGPEGGRISPDATVYQDIEHRPGKSHRFATWPAPSTYLSRQGEGSGDYANRKYGDDGLYGVAANDGRIWGSSPVASSPHPYCYERGLCNVTSLAKNPSLSPFVPWNKDIPLKIVLEM